MFFVLFVLHDSEKCNALLTAWEEAGIKGATVMHSTGLGRMRGSGWMDDLPLFPSIDSMIEHEEFFNRSIFTVVESENCVDQLVAATEKVVGNLSQPETGFLVVLPVVRVYGLQKAY